MSTVIEISWWMHEWPGMKALGLSIEYDIALNIKFSKRLPYIGKRETGQ